METIFDHNITGIEIEVLNSFMPNGAIKSREYYTEKEGNDKVYSDLYHLYMLRGESVKAEQFLTKIKNPEYKNILSVF